jgi:hypothetical protein
MTDSSDRVWIFHARNREVIPEVGAYFGKGAVTVAFRKQKVCSPTGADVRELWSAGWAVCSEQDQFSRKLGRTIATGRLNKLSQPATNGSMRAAVGTPEEIIEAVMDDIHGVYSVGSTRRMILFALARILKSRLFENEEGLAGSCVDAAPDESEAPGFGKEYGC